MSNDGFKRHHAVGDSNPYLVTCATCGADVTKRLQDLRETGVKRSRLMVGECAPELDGALLESVERLRRDLIEELRELKREIRQRGRESV